jgi:ferredoxin
MSHIIGSACISCLDSSCVIACPVDCINGPIIIDGLGKEIKTMTDEEKIGKQMYINPEVCIDCGACIQECPVDAIYRNEKEAIALGDEVAINKNYEFYGQTFSKNF